MAVRGQRAKSDITNKILEVFPGSFVYNKEIRIPYVEDGVDGQIKIVLTAAKTNVENGGGDAPMLKTKTGLENTEEKLPQEPTAEEKERLKMLLDKLGLSEG